MSIAPKYPQGATVYVKTDKGITKAVVTDSATLWESGAFYRVVLISNGAIKIYQESEVSDVEPATAPVTPTP